MRQMSKNVMALATVLGLAAAGSAPALALPAGYGGYAGGHAAAPARGPAGGARMMTSPRGSYGAGYGRTGGAPAYARMGFGGGRTGYGHAGYGGAVGGGTGGFAGRGASGYGHPGPAIYSVPQQGRRGFAAGRPHYTYGTGYGSGAGRRYGRYGIGAAAFGYGTGYGSYGAGDGYGYGVATDQGYGSGYGDAGYGAGIGYGGTGYGNSGYGGAGYGAGIGYGTRLRGLRWRGLRWRGLWRDRLRRRRLQRSGLPAGLRRVDRLRRRRGLFLPLGENWGGTREPSRPSTSAPSRARQIKDRVSEVRKDVAGQGRISMAKLSTLIAVAILVGTEVVGASWAAGWAIGGIMQLPSGISRGMEVVFGLGGFVLLFFFMRVALRHEPVRDEA